ncbi:disease resistance protein (TIR-NBS-LRR class) family [Actinidia rufa]|uniref:Disease resistance protein (TIR-NBS-LRR class) family n=1 Tax=Actinidia rufa TaxID=165716 RepID=A0A7J0F2I9_9ERIC|nr:disease resistance protein (TIR-NBS-LRR class) family [Actinidia rufa]
MPVKSVSNTRQRRSEDFLDNSTLIYGSNSSKRRRLGLFSWLPTYSSLTESFLESDQEDLKTDAFLQMHKLRILQLYNVQLIGSYKKFPKKLRWLCWHGFPLKFMPNDFPLEGLVVLDMRNSSLEQLWKGTKLPPELGKMESLKVLHADGINQLSLNTGEVKPWHEHVWSWISRPKRSPECICFSLTSLPRSLLSLNLANCNLSGDGIPKDLGTLSSLQSLFLSGNPICSLPGSLKGLTKLRDLELDYCTMLQSLPELPMSLAGLSLNECRSLEMVANIPRLFNSLNLDMVGCEKLVEVKGLFKLEPIGNIDSEMINNLSLTELDSMGMLEVELFSNLVVGRIIKKAPTLQVLYECGIYSIFLPGSEIPGWFDKKSRGSSMSFTVPSIPHLKFRGLNICVVYTRAMDFDQAEWSCECMKISNKTKGLKWAYCPIYKGMAYEDKDVIWLSDWKMIVNQLMEGGDEVNVYVNMAQLFSGERIRQSGFCMMIRKKRKAPRTTPAILVIRMSLICQYIG